MRMGRVHDPSHSGIDRWVGSTGVERGYYDRRGIRYGPLHGTAVASDRYVDCGIRMSLPELASAVGAVRWKGVSLNPETGAIHVVACENGAYYAERQ